MSAFQIECRQSDDPVKTDLELTCTVCGAHLCDVEAGDNLGTLAGVAEDHQCATPTKRVPDFSLDLSGEYSGNAYPEERAYRVCCTGNDADGYILTVEDNSGAIVGTSTITEDEVDGIDKAALTDHSLEAYGDDWTFPPGIERTLTWVLPTDIDVHVELRENHISEFASWLRYASGQEAWDWEAQGQEWVR